MRPFKRTLSERYSKLVKLIKSIDSHFELTEDKEKSLRLHLPNYKGNQPMDFHIYLLEPFHFVCNRNRRREDFLPEQLSSRH